MQVQVNVWQENLLKPASKPFIVFQMKVSVGSESTASDVVEFAKAGFSLANISDHGAADFYSGLRSAYHSLLSCYSFQSEPRIEAQITEW